eukprot:1362539-Rhodomonas_salina.1
MIVQKIGPELSVQVLNVDTGAARPISFSGDKTDMANADHISSFAFDPHDEFLYVASSSTPALVLALDLGSGRLNSTTTLTLGNVWNLAVLEATKQLLAVRPFGFSTQVLAIGVPSWNVSVLNETSGTVVRGIYALDRERGRYFFIVGGGATRSVVRVDSGTGKTEKWGLTEFVGIESMHWDEPRQGLLCVMATETGQVPTLKILDWESRSVRTLVDIAEFVPPIDQQAFRATFSPLSRHGLVQTSSGSVFVSRDPRGSSIGLFDLATHLSTKLTLPDVVGFVSVPDIRFSLLEAVPRDIFMSASVSITVTGQNFGKRDLHPTAMIGGVAVQSVQWQSDTSVLVFTNPGSSASEGPATLTLMARGGSDSLELNFVPSWHTLTPVLVPARGGGNVTVVGAGFLLKATYECSWGGQDGPTGSGSRVAVRAERVSSTQIKCQSPPWIHPASCSGPESACHSDVPLFLYEERSSGTSRRLLSSVPGAPSIRIIEGHAAQLSVVQSPAIIMAGADQARPFRVAVQDAWGRDVGHSNYTVAVRAYGSGGENRTISGQTVEETRAGVAAFGSIHFETSTRTYVLQFQVILGAGAADIAPVSIAVSMVSSGAASQLHVRVEPGAALGGTAMGVMPQISILDAFGNVVRDWSRPVSVVLAPNTNIALSAPGNWSFYSQSGCCQLSGTTSIAVVNGTATFTDIAISTAARGYQLLFSSHTLVPASSTLFAVSPGPPALLYMVSGLTPPGSLFLAMEPLLPAPEIHVLDAGRNLVRANATVNATLHSDASVLANSLGDDILLGVVAEKSINGVAVFDNLLVVKRRYAYVLVFRSPGLQSFTSWSFNVRPGAPTALGVLQQPSDGIATLVLSVGPVAAVLDAGNNTAYATMHINASVWIGGVRIAESFSQGSALVDQLQATASVGVARFDAMRVAVASNAIRVQFSAAGLRAVFTDPFSVRNSVAVRLFLLQTPLGSSGGLPFQQQPIVD